MTEEDRGLLRTVCGNGVPLLLITAGSLVFAGGFAMFLAASGEFLPHDIRYLGMSASDLCGYAECRIVGFMVHDRASFGAAMLTIGVLYTYLALFPLSRGEAWAWWLLVLSGLLGFFSFLAYLTYGYLDTWHGIGTLLLLPVFALGMVMTRKLVTPWQGPLSLIKSGRLPDTKSLAGLGRAILILSAGGTAIGGLVILTIGLTSIFVPEDLAFMQMSAEQLDAISPRLVPLIAHDRAGFGGAVFTTGLTALVMLWCAPMTRALWETLAIGSGVSLPITIAAHTTVGYTDIGHLMPVLAASTATLIGLALTFTKRARMGNSATNPLHRSKV